MRTPRSFSSCRDSENNSKTSFFSGNQLSFGFVGQRSGRGGDQQVAAVNIEIGARLAKKAYKLQRGAQHENPSLSNPRMGAGPVVKEITAVAGPTKL